MTQVTNPLSCGVLDKGRIAIEVKIANNVAKQHIKGLIEFSKDYQPEKSIVVSLDLK